MEPATLQDDLILEFQAPDGRAILLGDLGADFMRDNGLHAARQNDPLRIAIEPRTSKAGNTYYEYMQNGLPLPQGLDTRLVLEGEPVEMGPTRPSKNGHPTREGTAEIELDGTAYLVRAYITQGRYPYWVKVIAHKEPSKSPSQGGRFV